MQTTPQLLFSTFREGELKAGDVIVGIGASQGIRRRIVEVRTTGYSWRHADDDSGEYRSEDSNDPWFCWNWTRE